MAVPIADYEAHLSSSFHFSLHLDMLNSLASDQLPSYDRPGMSHVRSVDLIELDCGILPQLSLAHE